MIATCTDCGASWLGADAACPGCGRDSVHGSDGQPSGTPELHVPFALDPERVASVIEAFVGEVRFATDELEPHLLAERVQAVWWPHWLVDTSVEASWEAEVGYDYEVESSVEEYGASGWTRRQVTETRVRWEPRAGTISREYPNIPVSGLADQKRRNHLLGTPTLTPLIPWNGDSAPIRLPEHSPDEQWPAALASLRQRVGIDCATACGAQHVRGIHLDLNAQQADWTWLLLPGFTTWYDDDDGQRRVLWIDGATGRIGGPRMASPRKGRRAAIGLAVLSAVLGVLGVLLGLVGMVLLPLLIVSSLCLIFAFVFVFLSIPAAMAPDRHNRNELANLSQPHP